jgi:glycosyltransferase involved in cell wall biosynthesis
MSDHPASSVDHASAPTVSVVMSVYNGAATLERTLESVLRQECVDFEFIVVDDGSTDGSGAILDAWASRDARLRVIHQENTGLTRALIRGCAAARGEFIARQDCGDISLPGRLAAQAAELRARPDCVLLACAAEFVAPEGQRLGLAERPGKALEAGLAVLDVDCIAGPPHHGSVMFRRRAYERVGGYRPQFFVAQDLDLWLRLVEVGHAWGLSAPPFYAAEVGPEGISAERRAEQFALAKLAIDCARERRRGGDDSPMLSTAPPRPRMRAQGPLQRRRRRAAGLFFLAARLQDAGYRAASRRYLGQALRIWPLHGRAWWRLVRGMLA